MVKKGHSEPNIFGGYTHYDEKGKKIGRSDPGIFGEYTHYDAEGKKIGRSDPGIFGGYTHYDNKGHRTGRSDPGVFGGYYHFDGSGKKTGSSIPGVFGGYTNKEGNDACYVATCIYGSYDCPEVWTLRRFRDRFLKKHFLGRAFIRIYYDISPGMIARRGTHKTFRKFWRRVLDPFVSHLNARGYSDKVYHDKS